ncbi:MAG: T9SS type A sorting domain-containing protein [Chlorobi bacterium]|nr:T9SS type A sorting domain-containing protein [Chlorobiota bacterium]MCI0715652.1 T9SS type A sorting domain-containing protein [Chlorobiota bacterium]
MAVATGMQVRTLITDLASPEAGSNWIENGNIKMTLLWSLSYPQNIVRYNSLVSRFRTWVLSSARDKWDSLIYFLPQNREFLSQVGNCQIPILIQNTWQDRFFNTLGMIRSAYILPYNNYRMYFGPMDGHGSDYNINEEIFKEQIYGDWLDYHQLNIQNNVMNVNEKFTYCLSSFPTQGDSSYWSWQRFYSPTWPPNGVQNIKLYFHPGGLLHMLSYSGSTSYFTFLNDVLNPNVSMETLANYEFNIDSLRNRNLFDKREVIFETPALLQNARLMGTPYVYLYYYSDADLCQINMQLFEVEPNGNEKLVTRINWTDRYNIPNVVRQKYVNGQAIGHLFKAGNRLRIKITNIDSQPPYKDFFLRTNPFVLPVLKRANNRIYVSGSSKSYIELPMLNFVIGIHQISSEIPNGFKLHQNYPNPFNPITKIRFEVPPTGKNNYVQIKVYDVAGKELTTLVDENLNTGVYETDFDGSNFASGVYFYRIVSGNYSKVKKMILVK